MRCWCLAFNVKFLAAYLVVPGIALAFLVCAPGPLARRVLQLAVAGLVMLAVSFAWIAFVELTPASERPWVGDTTTNSELGLTFEYNGVQRVGGGGEGGPGEGAVPRPGARVPSGPHPTPAAKAVAAAALNGTLPAVAAARASPVRHPRRERSSSVRAEFPVTYGHGPLRLVSRFGFGDQDGWMLPFAVFGALGLLTLLLLERRSQNSPPQRGTRPGLRDPRLACLLVFGGWLLVEVAVLSLSKGIVHPYYTSALAPGAGAMAGAGAVAVVILAKGKRRVWGLVLAILAVLFTLGEQIVLMYREHYMLWFIPVLIAACVGGLAAFVISRRLAAPALALVFAVLLVAPTGYAASTWLAPVEGTFPAAGPTQVAGYGGYGIDKADLAIDLALVRYVRTHGPGSKWTLLTVASGTAEPFILMGLDVGALGGYSGTDPAIDGPGLARLVALGQARYVLLGGVFSGWGGNRATAAVLHACKQLAPSTWESPVTYPYGLTLFDCDGRQHALASS